jgi:hypothetical protein
VTNPSDKTGDQRQDLPNLTTRILIRKHLAPQQALPGLHVIAQHQLFWVPMHVHLLVYPLGNGVAVQGRALKARALAEAAPPEVAAASAVTL